MYTATKQKYIVQPKAPYTMYKKHIGYYCIKCKSERLLNVMRLCPCLDLVEDPKVVKHHINTFWVDTYAHMETPPPRPPASVR